jgi:hypothetical protein
MQRESGVKLSKTEHGIRNGNVKDKMPSQKNVLNDSISDSEIDYNYIYEVERDVEEKRRQGLNRWGVLDFNLLKEVIYLQCAVVILVTDM